jgi:hypothetical protein
MLKQLFVLVTFLESISAVGQPVKYSDIIGKEYLVTHKDSVSIFYFHDTGFFYALIPDPVFDQQMMKPFSYKLKKRDSLEYLEFSEQNNTYKYYLLISKLNNKKILIQGNKQMDSTILTNPNNVDSKHNWKLTQFHEREVVVDP